MKNSVLTVLVLLLAGYGFSAVEITAEDGGNSDLVISYNTTDGEVVRGIGLKITIDGAEFASLDDLMITFDTDVDLKFAYLDNYHSDPTILDSLDFDELPGPIGQVFAAAKVDEPGLLDTLPATEFSICIGVLDASAQQRGVSTDGSTAKILATIKLSNFAGESACVTVEEDTLRGGIQGDNITAITVPENCVPVANIPDDCVKMDAPFYNDWVAFNRPDCWCYRKNCNADATGAMAGPFRVSTPDLLIFLDSFNKLSTQVTSEGICADFDHLPAGPFRVSTPELSKLLAYFNKLDSLVPECPMDWDNDGDDDYNFWIDP